MKIIDLLNKIANGEEVPNKIKYRNKIFIYDIDNQCYVVENYNKYDDLYMSLSNHKGTDLHYEVEIIEEPKEHKIPEKLKIRYKENDILVNEKILQEDINDELANKINEIIDYLEVNNDGER